MGISGKPLGRLLHGLQGQWSKASRDRDINAGSILNGAER
ncbi:hypothetical protein EIO60_01676|nr:hypothetical protein [Candidatus Pantoea persica]